MPFGLKVVFFWLFYFIFLRIAALGGSVGQAPVYFRWILLSRFPCALYPEDLRSCKQFRSKQTLQLFIQILPQICNVCPPLPEKRGGGVTAGYKNAYSSLWLVHKLAAGRLGLGLGRGPGPELAQLLAAMLSLPQPQPHCAKLLHTYNLLIMHEVFKGVKKVYCRTKESVEN